MKKHGLAQQKTVPPRRFERIRDHCARALVDAPETNDMRAVREKGSVMQEGNLALDIDEVARVLGHVFANDSLLFGYPQNLR